MRPLERLSRVAAREHGDDRVFRLALIDQLARELPFAAFAWLLTDPATAVGASPLADLGGLVGLDALPVLIGLKYRTGENRWTALSEAAGLHLATNGQLARSELWRDLLAARGVVDVASVVFRDDHGTWGFLDLWRAGDQQPFSAAEIALLAAAADSITAGLRGNQALTFTPGPARPDGGGPAVIVLAPDLAVRVQTPETEAFLRALLPAPGELPPVPAAAYNVAAQLLAVEAGIDDHPARARVHLAGGRWVTVRAARIGPDADGTARDIAVTIEPTTPADRLDLYCRAAALTARETELLGHLAAGADTRGVAARMHLSEHTVQDHLKSIFAKTDTRNRRTLLSRATGL